MIDQGIVGSWKLSGCVFNCRKYIVDSFAGAYFIADAPTAPVFDSSGNSMQWNGLVFNRIFGNGSSHEGVWIEASSGEEWTFRADFSVTVHVSPSEEYFGRWEIVAGLLEYAEYRGRISTEANLVSIHPPYDDWQTYTYAVNGTGWSISDLASGDLVAQYEQYI